MHISTKLSTVINIVIFSLIGAFPVFASAYTISTYATSLSKSTDLHTSTYILIQNGNSGTPNTLSLYLDANVPATQTFSGSVVQCTGTTYTGCYVYASVSGSAAIASTKTLATLNITGATTTMQADKYYYLNVSWGAADHIYGYTIDPYPLSGRVCNTYASGSSCGSLDTSLRAAYYDLDGSQGDKTSILQVQPFRLSATSTPVTLNALIHVGAVDITGSNVVNVAIDIASISQAGVLPATVARQRVYATQLNTAGDIRIQSVQSGLSAEYQMWVYVNDYAGSFIDATTTTFTVGTSTVWGQIQLSALNQQAEISQALTATTTAGYAAQCAVWYGSTGAFHDCVTYLFVPSTQYLGDALYKTVTNIVSIWPLGYMTRVATIAAHASQIGDVSILPSLIFTMPVGYPGAGTTFDLTPWSLLLSDSSILSSATNPNTGHTLKQIVQPLWNTAVYAFFVFAVAMQLLKIDYGVTESESMSETDGVAHYSRRLTRRRNI